MFLTYLFFIPSMLFAQTQIKGLSFDVEQFNYKNNQGIGLLNHLSFNLLKSNSSEARSFTIKKEKGKLIVKLDPLSLSWSTPPNWILAFNEVLLRDLKGEIGSLGQDQHSVFIKEIYLQNEASKIQASSVDVFCGNNNTANSLKIQILRDCLENMKVQIDRLQVEFLDKLLSPIGQSFPEEEEPRDQVKPDLLIEILNGQLNLEYKLKLLFTGRLRLKANIENTPRSYLAKIETVNWGYLNVKDLFFNILINQNPSERIIINPPFIEILK
jgi:hypothetical protein